MAGRTPWRAWWPVALVIPWLALVGAFELIKTPDAPIASLCLFRNMTGVPCPTCGSTRAVLALGRGNVGDAIAMNPLVVLTVLAAVVWLGARALGCAWWPVRGWRSIMFAAAGLAIANWLYVVMRSQQISAPS